jgi:hypothetical protein
LCKPNFIWNQIFSHNDGLYNGKVRRQIIE